MKYENLNLKEVINSIGEANIKYVPIQKNDYLKIRHNIEGLGALVLLLGLSSLISGVVAVFIVIAKIIIYFFNLSFYVSLETSAYCFIGFVVAVLIASFIDGKLTKILNKNGLIKAPDDGLKEFEEIDSSKYNDVKRVCLLDDIYKNKIQEVLDLRGGRIFNFDFYQLNTDMLASLYKKLEKQNKETDEFNEIKSNVLKEVFEKKEKN